MGLIDTADVKRLLQDADLMSEIANALVDDPAAMEALADDIADELDDELEDDPEFKKRIIEAAMANPQFKKKLVSKLIADMDD